MYELFISDYSTILQFISLFSIQPDSVCNVSGAPSPQFAKISKKSITIFVRETIWKTLQMGGWTEVGHR